MTNFKGTKGKWKVRGEYRIDIITDNDKAFGIVDFGTEQEAFLADYPIEQWKANALLISKAPEMLEMLEEINNDFEIWDSLPSNLQERMYKLIKEATEHESKPVLAVRAVEECICTTDCLGCYHKDRKCKKLRGHDR